MYTLLLYLATSACLLAGQRLTTGISGLPSEMFCSAHISVSLCKLRGKMDTVTLTLELDIGTQLYLKESHQLSSRFPFSVHLTAAPNLKPLALAR